MTEPTAATAKTKTAKHTASPFGLPSYEMPKFDLLNAKVPEAFRELAEKGVAQAKENYEKMQAAGDAMTGILDQTYSAAVKGVADYNYKLIEMARANSNSALEFACGLIAMKSLPEMVELSTEQTRKQFELVAEQSKELWALAQKMATETAEPLKTGVTKGLNNQLASA